MVKGWTVCNDPAVICYNAPMTLIIDAYPIPETGKLEIEISRTVDIHISAAEAKRQCDDWLSYEIMPMLFADEPDLRICNDGRAVWRIPIVFKAHVGIVGGVGYVDMDVMTAELLYSDHQIEKILKQMRKLGKTVPPRPKQTLSTEFYPPPHLEALPSKEVSEEYVVA